MQTSYTARDCQEKKRYLILLLKLQDPSRRLLFEEQPEPQESKDAEADEEPIDLSPDASPAKPRKQFNLAQPFKLDIKPKARLHLEDLFRLPLGVLQKFHAAKLGDPTVVSGTKGCRIWDAKLSSR